MSAASVVASCTSERIAAAGSSTSRVASRKIETSSVSSGPPRKLPPAPSSSTTPNEVNVNMKTSAEAEAIAGKSAGSVTCVKVATRPAPSSLAASSVCGSRFAQTPETSRITTETL